MHLILKWLISALALLIVSSLLPGIHVSTLGTALIVAFILGLLNALVRPVLIVLTLPINILTLGLFTFVLNGLIFWFIASFIEGFAVDGFLVAILGAFFVSVISWIGNWVLNDTKANRHYRRPPVKSYYRVDKIEKPNEKE